MSVCRNCFENSILGLNSTYINEVSTRHDMNYGQVSTPEVLPKIPLKLTQSIQGALRKSCNSKYLFLNAKTNEGEIGLYFKNDKKMLGGATSQKSQKEI
jgi:hypothetical protein